jgi:uncharacterized membrane protein SpoIIM required for sporulation
LALTYPEWLEARRERWESLARQLDLLEGAPERLDHRELEALAVGYRQALHDLALSRERFAGTAAADWIQRLVVRANRLLHDGGGGERRGLYAFFRHTFPNAVRLHGQELAVATSVFLISTLLGVCLTSLDATVGSVFVGQAQIEGLARGELWTDQVADNSPFFGGLIARNNTKVALTAWAGGALLGLGSLLVLATNGLMLGSVVLVTAHYSMAPRLLEFIAAHGPLELTLIVFSAAAGLKLGRSLLEADESPLAERLTRAGRDSTRLVLGCLPFFLILGFVESYVSPDPRIDALIKIAVGLSLEATFLALAFAPAAPTRSA